MNKGELIYLKMSNGDRVFLNANDIIAVFANRITMNDNDNDDNNNISIESQGTKLEFYMNDKSHFEYTFSDNDPDGMRAIRQLKNFVSEEAFR